MSNKWKLSREKQKGKERFVIKRWTGSKPQRLATKTYELIRNNEEELQKLVIRLNDQLPIEQKTREMVQIQHAFISPLFLEDYRQYLLIQIPSKRQALFEFHCLVTYFLHFFIHKLHISNPLKWHIVHKTAWAQFLLSDQAPKSANAKKIIISSANRFMNYLHEHRPTEVPPLKFSPFTKAKYKEIEAKRQISGEARERAFISQVDIKLILKNLPKDIAPFIKLAYHYGLRRSETLGLKPNDVRRGYLSVERQLALYNKVNTTYTPLKGRESRKVPHWLCEPANAAEWIVDGQTSLMHPDTLSDRWAKLMRYLGLEYDFHDLRHTWITMVMRTQNSRDVQLSAGHKSIQTTMGYLHDDREMADEIFKPKKAS